MNNARAIKAAVTIATCSAAAAFIPPVPLGKSCSAAPASSPPFDGGNGKAGQAPKSRGVGAAASAVAPLKIGGFSFSSISDIFNRPAKDTGTCIPQDDKADKPGRKKQLAQKQKDYKWSTSGIPVGTPFLEGFPPGEEFPQVTWIAQLVGALLSIAVGTLR
ncbi:unnamed protein product [Laminaria digitata]